MFSIYLRDESPGERGDSSPGLAIFLLINQVKFLYLRLMNSDLRFLIWQNFQHLKSKIDNHQSEINFCVSGFVAKKIKGFKALNEVMGWKPWFTICTQRWIHLILPAKLFDGFAT